MHVANVHFKCFRGMLQVFYRRCKSRSGCLHMLMVVHVCCKRLSPMFHLFFRRALQVCLPSFLFFSLFFERFSQIRP
jgi:hypothetical protein